MFSIGIISGAGPMAGVELLRLIIEFCQKEGAFRDRDFPEIHLINIPFSEMLAEDFDKDKYVYMRFETEAPTIIAIKI